MCTNRLVGLLEIIKVVIIRSIILVLSNSHNCLDRTDVCLSNEIAPSTEHIIEQSIENF